ncbi:TetR/AcrR family transcriptional regulator C-terminal domain-containing protein [Gordonia jinhuaensis]|uniref:Tetracycline repressor, C-all-alpha domain protein n=1 Tax=Gordonia jinhuaensis TaxID=1517702 RepID=A0A916TA41_9ACTN|nr:TetR/AcrR family transcriptional regulator [Gordonia jinhuaensis]GGB37297.1 tetracycline repressor, C-all-alpha domain protein [Gordonia jinhuaensis]
MGRPRSPLLDTDRIAAAAMSAIDERGMFTMPGLARDLGVAVSSLYHHVSGRDQILEMVRGTLLNTQLSGIDDDAPWQETLRRWVCEYRDVFGSHPELVRLLTAQTVSNPGIVSLYDRISKLLEDNGFRVESILHVITLLDDFALGAALDMAAPDVVWDTSGLPADAPLARAAAAVPSGRQRADGAFELGLDIVIAGLERFRDAGLDTSRGAAGSGAGSSLGSDVESGMPTRR